MGKNQQEEKKKKEDKGIQSRGTRYFRRVKYFFTPQKDETRLQKFRRILGVIIYVLLAVSIVYAIYHISKAEEGFIGNGGKRLRGDYVLTLLQCLVGVLVITIPSFLDERFNLAIPDNIQIMYFLFLFAAIYLGEVQNFYFRFKHWDDILHFTSGATLASIGFLLINVLNNNDKMNLYLSPFFMALFAVSFAVLCGVIWEIYEWTADSILNTNMQKFMSEHGEVYVGRAALEDTMIDLIVDLFAAMIVSVVGYFSIKNEKKDQETIGKIKEIKKANKDI